MAGRRQESSLYYALGSFGVCAKRLDAEHLDIFPEVLVELFGDEILANSGERQRRAGQVAVVLENIIASIDDETDQLVARAVFAAAPEFYGENVEGRKKYLRDKIVPSITWDNYKDRRPKIVRYVAAALRRAVEVEAVSKIDLLSPEARYAARQLYRYAQQALLRIEEYDWSSRCVWKIPQGNRHIMRALFVPPDGGTTCEETLWLFVHAQRYLREVMSDFAASEFLRENLSVRWWGDRIGIPFLRDPDWIEMERIRNACDVDNPRTFVERLRREGDGKEMYRSWQMLVTERPKVQFHQYAGDVSHISDLNSLRLRLVALCVLLRGLFPEDAMPADRALATWEINISSLTRGGLGESLGLVPEDDDVKQLREIAKWARENRPTRHIFGEDEDVPRW